MFLRLLDFGTDSLNQIIHIIKIIYNGYTLKVIIYVLF